MTKVLGNDPHDLPDTQVVPDIIWLNPVTGVAYREKTSTTKGKYINADHVQTMINDRLEEVAQAIDTSLDGCCHDADLVRSFKLVKT